MADKRDFQKKNKNLRFELPLIKTYEALKRNTDYGKPVY